MSSQQLPTGCSFRPALIQPVSYEDELSITSVCWAGSWRVTFCGAIDLFSAPGIGEAAAFIAARGGTDIEIDLSRVTFIDASGWNSIQRACHLLRAAGASCRLVEPSAAVLRVARILAHRPVWAIAA